MARFISSLRAEKSGDYWTLIHPLVYQSDVAQDTFVVPEGTVTDFASVPRIPLAFMLTGNAGHAPAALHDFLYSRGVVTREMADAVFLEALKVSGEPSWRATLMHWGVRMGGWIAWNGHRERDLVR